MSEFEDGLAAVGRRVEERLGELKLRLRRRAGAFRNLQLIPFRGCANQNNLFLEGRVLKETGIRTPLDEDRVWQNIVATYRRFHTVELPGATIRAEYDGTSADFRSDREGYFRVTLPRSAVSERTGPWEKVRLRLVHPVEEEKIVANEGFVRLPSPQAQFGVVSDIDDTILVTNVERVLRMFLATFLGNARTRSPFAGVGAFYRALECGELPPAKCDEWRRNPIFYVSSGPWNLYDLLVDFMELNSIPLGPLFLQDYGFDRDKFFKLENRTHKIRRIAEILEFYPELPFILVGDSGQKDPEIYTEVLASSPNRIRAIYIRDVSSRTRAEQVKELARAAKAHGGELVLVKNSYDAARHAAERGFISSEMLDSVRAEAEADERPQDPSNLPFEA
jgi:phosphatidate phosphatase APP1